MADLVASPKAPRPATPRLADRAARLYSPLVHLLSFSAFGYWMWTTGGDVRFAINISAAVLIITCPCALGLAVPAVVTAASGKLFRKGLLIKHGTALERLAEVDTVVFDKTGTLTLGMPEPTNLADHPSRSVGRRRGPGRGPRRIRWRGRWRRRRGRRHRARAGRPTCARCRAMASKGHWQGTPRAAGPRRLVRGRARWPPPRPICALGDGRPARLHLRRPPAPRGRGGGGGAARRRASSVLLISGDAEGAVRDLAAAAGHHRLDGRRAACRKGRPRGRPYRRRAARC